MPRSGWGLSALLALCACSYQGAPLCQNQQDCIQPAPDAGGGICKRDTDCPLGAICDGTRCLAGCRSSRDCPAGNTCDTSHKPYGICVSPTHLADAAPADVALPDVTPPAPDATPPDAGPCVDQWVSVVQNPSFDLGPGHGWVEHPAHGDPIILQTNSAPLPHSGTYIAWLGGIASATESITQSITIPADAEKVRLSFWYQIGSTNTTAIEQMGVAVDNSQLMVSFTDLDKTTFWTQSQVSQDLVPGASSVHTVFATIVNGSTGTPASFYLDDVDVQVLVCR